MNMYASYSSHKLIVVVGRAILFFIAFFAFSFCIVG